MANYNYRAKKGLQEIINGTIEAVSEKEAIEKISALGYLPISLEEAKNQQKFSPAPVAYKTHGRIKGRQITTFSRQLSSLLKSGVPILSAINIIREQSENVNLKAVLYDIYNVIKNGGTFSSALEVYPKYFPVLYIAMVRTGENSGALAASLLRIADYRAKQEELISRFRMAMAYPILMALVGIATVVFMLTYVMPRLMGIFSSLGQNLPLPTQILLALSKGLRQWWPWMILIILAAVVLIKQQLNTKMGRLTWSVCKLRIPIFGNFALKADLACFSRTLELLLKSGLPILSALQISVQVLNNEVIKEKLMKSYRDLEQGGSLGRSLKDSKLLPLFMVNLISIGEESGNLASSLGEVADSYERDTDEMIKVMSSLLEPLMILAMGLIVGFIVIAMLLPIFEINLMSK
ncbi:MAG TPA: type II secretion system F family protein [Candidatus Omnitrophota bacterium]|nr:type II secretion system F family protein [Candidatus Omnitrophota bacterium]HPT39476.1 type II secretion system F family protein [Candidatus Omnitrophota bacterium]